MTSAFLLPATALITGAIVLLLWPILRRRGRAEVARRSLNVSLYRHRLAELHQEHDVGLLDATQYQAAREELENALHADAMHQDVDRSQGARRHGAPVLVLAAIVVPAVALALQWQLTDTRDGALQEAPLAEAAAADPDPAMRDLEARADALAERLAADPEQPEGWAMLARARAHLGQRDRAVTAFAEAYQRDADNAELTLDYAEARITAADGTVTSAALELVEAVLEQHSNNPRARWLAGVAHYQRLDYDQAASHWQRLLEGLPDASEAAVQVRAAVTSARSLAGAESAAEPVDEAAVATVFDIELRLDASMTR